MGKDMLNDHDHPFVTFNSTTSNTKVFLPVWEDHTHQANTDIPCYCFSSKIHQQKQTNKEQSTFT